ncbi:hypothetical protein MSBRW_2740 [Methanosarcina barkeri str. Wiesmoor]|uniref:Uncharacterized protein n=1 Tax=Methanosarcina barkeri str. Wiesmoor TaxID=1434109 RepID=A0A0E3QPA1_METBA|nr:hypothetical protein MSBRW_2740 [Methanosarcina barkeri str. Wiesmoor]
MVAFSPIKNQNFHSKKKGGKQLYSAASAQKVIVLFYSQILHNQLDMRKFFSISLRSFIPFPIHSFFPLSNCFCYNFM